MSYLSPGSLRSTNGIDGVDTSLLMVLTEVLPDVIPDYKINPDELIARPDYSDNLHWEKFLRVDISA